MKKFEMLIGLDESGNMTFTLEVNESLSEALIDFLNAHNQINKAAQKFFDGFLEDKNVHSEDSRTGKTA